MGKGPPTLVLPVPAAASWASLASWAACVRRWLCSPEELGESWGVSVTKYLERW